MLSDSQLRHNSDSDSSKNLTPSCSARSGICSMIASLMRHVLSSASLTIAGMSDCDSRSMPITWFNELSVEMIFNRTSGLLSLRSNRYSGRKLSIVESLPTSGARPITTSASDDLTWSFGSLASLSTDGRSISTTMLSGRHFATAVTWLAAAVLTSASASSRSFTNAGASSCSVTSGPMALATLGNWSATDHLTRQDLSEASLRTAGRIFSSTSA
mmetsp:Transcript_21702/g.42636  ORF Transcript_21702/g.42636 Transcript_21702/m.42636 type:complete len:215 (+) Transcript_21702:510-1154(+)